MSPETEERNDLGALATALAKAQSEFGAIPRSKTVSVTSQRTGKSYTFSYAPLDTILNSVREPLAKNGLAIAQLLDDGHLVTMLLHESGANLTGRTTLPDSPDIQAFGSTITYLRRYAIQSLLGIAAEEDDDGNRGVGNSPTTRGQRAGNPPSQNGHTRPSAPPPVTTVPDPDEDAVAELHAANSASDVCQWKLGQGQGKPALICGLPTGHEGEHSWIALALASGGRVIPPVAAVR